MQVGMTKPTKPHYEYKIYRRDTGKLFCEGDSHACSAALGVTYQHFTGQKGEYIVYGLDADYYGERVWTGKPRPHKTTRAERVLAERKAKEAEKAKLAEQKEKISLVDDYCIGCAFRRCLSQFGYCCDYIEVMGMRRPCPAGAGCTVKRIGKVKRDQCWRITTAVFDDEY